MALRTIALVSLAIAAANPSARAAQDETARIKDSVSRTLVLFDKVGNEWKIPCASCHSQGLTMMAAASARRHGIAVNEAAVHAHAAKTLKMFSSVDGAVGMPLDTFTAYGFLAIQAQGVGRTMISELVARRLVNAQLPEGNWIVADARPPHSSSVFTGAALGARMIADNLPESMAVICERSLAKTRNWLLTHKPESTEDGAFRLLGLLWSGADARDRKATAAELLSTQRHDGGWAQQTGMESDAYSTGEALVALRQAGDISAAHPAFLRGIQFLLDTQKSDGSWLVKSRLHSPAPISPPFMDSGFPHGKDQFISTAGSAWAVMALAEALPEVSDPAKPLPLPEVEPNGVEPWMKVVAFGTTDEVAALLSNGFDPNTKSKSGLTPLMLAMPEIAKAKLLLDKGASATAASESGASPLKIAASYPGATPLVRMLADHGADLNPKGEPPTSHPFYIASATADTELLSFLIQKGVDPKHAGVDGNDQMQPMGNAIFADSPNEIRLLVKNGVDVNGQDNLKITPLIWASIMHRTAAVKALLEMGADPDVVDSFGMTALKHTEDIAYADPQTAAVLKEAIAAKQRVTRSPSGQPSASLVPQSQSAGSGTSAPSR